MKWICTCGERIESDSPDELEVWLETHKCGG